MQACGLKLKSDNPPEDYNKSRLMQACGLKQAVECIIKGIRGVTPHAGVWIETWWRSPDYTMNCVTPHAGVWIET